MAIVALWPTIPGATPRAAPAVAIGAGGWIGAIAVFGVVIVRRAAGSILVAVTVAIVALWPATAGAISGAAPAVAVGAGGWIGAVAVFCVVVVFRAARSILIAITPTIVRVRASAIVVMVRVMVDRAIELVVRQHRRGAGQLRLGR